jgi:hypothetical protein
MGEFQDALEIQVEQGLLRWGCTPLEAYAFNHRVSLRPRIRWSTLRANGRWSLNKGDLIDGHTLRRHLKKLRASGQGQTLRAWLEVIVVVR